MRIISVDLYPLMYPLKQPYGDANGLKKYRSSFLFRLTTQSGITGWGECTDWLPNLLTGFEGRIIPYLIGKLATNRQQLVQQIKQWHPRSAAGVSLALTEIIAKSSGLSICELWGGRWRDSVPVYASMQSYTDQVDWIQHSMSHIEREIHNGFNQFKVKVGGKTFKEDHRHIQLIQETYLKDWDCQLIIDANQSYDLATARVWEQSISQWNNLLWFEEPLPMHLVEDYRLLRACLSIPIAGGENLKSTSEFLPLVHERSLDIIQPDVLHEDGIDGYRHTLQLARYSGLRVSPHTFDGALSRLYALFAHACLPPWSKMLQQDIEPVEWDTMENPFTSITSIEPVTGLVSIPTGVGIGVEIDEEMIKRYRWDGSLYEA